MDNQPTNAIKEEIKPIEENKDIAKISSIDANERRKQIKELIETIGLWSINKSALALKFKVDRNTIKNDVKKIIKGIPKEELEEISFNLINAFKKAIAAPQYILAMSQNNQERLHAANTLAHVAKEFTYMLEQYNLKDKIAEKSEVVQEITVKFEDPFKDDTKQRSDNKVQAI